MRLPGASTPIAVPQRWLIEPSRNIPVGCDSILRASRGCSNRRITRCSPAFRHSIGNLSTGEVLLACIWRKTVDVGIASAESLAYVENCKDLIIAPSTLERASSSPSFVLSFQGMILLPLLVGFERFHGCFHVIFAVVEIQGGNIIVWTFCGDHPSAQFVFPLIFLRIWWR